MPDLIREIGAVAGLAAFLGLAVLALLYFAQARDVRRLRENAEFLVERPEEAMAPAAAEAGEPAEPAPAAATAAAATTPELGPPERRPRLPPRGRRRSPRRPRPRTQRRSAGPSSPARPLTVVSASSGAELASAA